MKVRLENGASIWHNKSGSIWLQRGGRIYVWMIDIGRLTIMWERNRTKR